MRITDARVAAFQEKIFSWWKTHKRDLPWRHTHDPYRILVSEIMLQQTQVSRVLPKYIEFLEKFPTARALASASTADVLKMWKGMGYNRRALYLKKAAEIGIFPDDEKELMKLPGVGTYTARAILVFAFKKNVAPVDTNIRQIITHFFFEDVPQDTNVIQKTADLLVPHGKSWEWHQALMDYGALALNASPIIHAKSHKPTVPFKESNRFYRGRIIDVLREGNISENKLVIQMVRTYGKSNVFMKSIITRLLADSLLVRHDGILKLPQ